MNNNSNKCKCNNNHHKPYHQYNKLVRKVASELYAPISKLGSIIDFEDLLQVGYMAMLESLERFDKAKGVKEMTYMYPNIKGKMIRYIGNNLSPVKQNVNNPIKNVTTFLDTQTNRGIKEVDTVEINKDEEIDISTAYDLLHKLIKENLTDIEISALEERYGLGIECKDFPYTRASRYTWTNKAIKRLRRLLLTRPKLEQILKNII